MADFDAASGARGTIRIRDTGSTIEFWIYCSDPSTYAGSVSWSGTVNGAGQGGSVSLPAGFGSKLVAVWNITSSQTVSFSIGDTGTWGLGGPTSVSANISRGGATTRPSVPGNPTFSEITPTSVRVSWTASASNGGSAIDGYLLRQRTVQNGSYTDVSVQNNLSRVVTGLTPGVTYWFSVYAHNSSPDNSGFSQQTAQMPVTASASAYVGKGGTYPPAAAVQAGKAGGYVAASVLVGKAGGYTPAG